MTDEIFRHVRHVPDEQNCSKSSAQPPSVVRSVKAKRRGRLEVRLTEQLDQGIKKEAKARGYSIASAFLRAAVEHELSGRSDGLTGAEERIAATIESMRRELFRLGRGQQALFAYVDSLAKVLLTCIPEPPQEARAQAIARAKDRHNRLVNSAGSSMEAILKRQCLIW